MISILNGHFETTKLMLNHSKIIAKGLLKFEKQYALFFSVPDKDSNSSGDYVSIFKLLLRHPEIDINFRTNRNKETVIIALSF